MTDPATLLLGFGLSVDAAGHYGLCRSMRLADEYAQKPVQMSVEKMEGKIKTLLLQAAALNG